jgi:hypothetical protein
MNSLTKTFFSVALAASVLGCSARAQVVGENIALHQTVTTNPAPNSPDTKTNDLAQITDGLFVGDKPEWDNGVNANSLWVQKGAVGWQHKKPVVITIDLGKVQPISGLSYSTAGGRAGVSWPDHIYIATSDDNKTWHYVGDLVSLSVKNGVPPVEGYTNFRYITRDLKTHGRYVALGIVENVFVFVDEVEVLRGEDALLAQPAGREIPEMMEFAKHDVVTEKARRRQNEDITSVRALLEKANIPAQQKSTLEARLATDEKATAEMQPLKEDFKTIVPITDAHRDILAVHGEVLAAQGLKPLTVWKKHRYAWLPLVHVPEQKQAAQLQISLLRNQFRSDAILLTNASGQPMTVNVRLQSTPAGAQDGWLKLDSAIWTDTYQGVPVQDALMPLDFANGVYSTTIPAGVTGKLWVTVDSSKLPAGTFKSTLAIGGAGQNISVPLNVAVSKVAMPTPRMSLIMWDDTDGQGHGALNPQNRPAAIALMRSHFLDTPSAYPSVLPLLKDSDFNANNQLIGKIDFTSFDQWVAMWPGSRNYFVFRNIDGTDTFADKKVGTPDFDARVGNWAKAIAAHMKELGLQPSQLILCLVDETRNESQDTFLLDWSKPIKAAVPEFRLFTDPIWREPEKASQEALTINDIICPHPNWENEYYVKLAHKYNRDLWFYNGPGMGRVGDPQLGYRQMAWRVFAANGRGMGFWSFWDTTHAPTSWNEYSATNRTYAPAFLDKETVYNSIHWDAVRDGIEDFEELSLLKDAIAKSKNSSLKAQAQKVLDDAVAAATALISDGSLDEDKGDYDWSKNNDPTVVDAQLAKLREILEKI